MKDDDHPSCNSSLGSWHMWFHIFKTSVEINFEKLLGHRVFKNHKIKIISNHVNLLQVCPSAPSFVFAVLFISSLNFVRDYFYSFTQFGCGYHCLNFDKFHHTFGWLENLCFCREMLCTAPLISQVQNNGFPSTFSEHSLVNINPSTGKKNWEFLVAFYVKWKSLLVDRLKGENIYYQTYVGCLLTSNYFLAVRHKVYSICTWITKKTLFVSLHLRGEKFFACQCQKQCFFYLSRC